MNPFSDPPPDLVGEALDPPGMRLLLPHSPREPAPPPPGSAASDVPQAPRDAGWYRDPTDARRHRYWTGQQWFSQDEVFPPVDGDGR